MPRPLRDLGGHDPGMFPDLAVAVESWGYEVFGGAGDHESVEAAARSIALCAMVRG